MTYDVIFLKSLARKVTLAFNIAVFDLVTVEPAVRAELSKEIGDHFAANATTFRLCDDVCYKINTIICIYCILLN